MLFDYVHSSTEDYIHNEQPHTMMDDLALEEDLPIGPPNRQ